MKMQPAGGTSGVLARPGVSWRERFATWRWRHRQPVIAYTILTPMLLYFILFIWVPIVVLAVFSLTEWNIVQWPPDFVGLKNYVQIFTDPYYHNVIRVTVTLGLCVLILNMSLGLFIALLLNEKITALALTGGGFALIAAVIAARRDDHVREDCSPGPRRDDLELIATERP